MVFNRINILKILLIFISAIVFLILMIKNTSQIETNLAKSILPKNIIQNTKIIPIMEKPSRTIKVIFEADDEEKVNLLKQNFISNLDSSVFTPEDADFSKIIDIYSKYPTNFLSAGTKKLLQNNDFETAYQQSLERLYNPVGIQIVDFNNDPFLLLSNFLLSNDINNKNQYFDSKFYDTTIVKIKPEVKNINTEITKIIKLKKQYSDKTQQIYLAGTPIHTYYTTLASSITINLVCILITALVIFLTYIFFKNYLLLLPIALSIAFGYLAGYSITNLIYNNFHLITLLFGTTLIGIGIDYSYHYIFAENKDFKLYKDLSLSFISTIIAFSLLYLLKIDILNQIATFTNIGLLAIFTFILTIYPCINFAKPTKFYNPNFKFNYRKTIILLMTIILAIGFFRLKFNDSLSSLYKPNKALIKSEQLFNKITNQYDTNGTVITVSSTSEDDLIENEEKVTSILDKSNINYISISKFFPSAKTQKENFELVKKLYNSKLDDYNSLLSKEQIKILKDKIFIPQNFKNTNNIFNDLLLDNKTSLIIPVSKTEIPELNTANIEVINFQKTISDQLKIYRIKLLKILPLIYLSLVLLLTIFYGIKNGIKMILPIVISSFLVISCTSLIGIELNLFNILGLLLALGFTIDYAIFNKNKTKETETAIFLACITTACSFILLSFTAFKLISNLALTLSLGIIFNYILIKIFTKKEV